MTGKQDRAERIRTRYAATAAARESTARFRNGFLTVALVAMGGLTLVVSGINLAWWGLLGGVVILAGIVPLRWAARHERFDMEPGSARTNALAMAAVALALGLFAVGTLVTKHPWG